MKDFARMDCIQAGLSREHLLAFLDRATQVGMHSFMLLRRGSVIAEGWWAPYAPEYPHMLHSLSKSFASTAIGFAVQEGLLTVNDRVADFFPEYLPCEPCENMRKMEIRHLLTMSTGHDDGVPVISVNAPQDWCKLFLHRYITWEPGTHFVYNTGATYMLSAIIQKVTGQTCFDYLTPRLFEPLGIRDIWWDSCPMGKTTGGFGLNLHTQDIAKFGQLFLQKGVWEGRQLLDPAWIGEATRKHVDNSGEGPDWRAGYGYQFWRCARENSYRGDGAAGQLCVVVPDKEMVFACTSSVSCTFQQLMDLIYEELIIPAGDTPAADDPALKAELAQRLASLTLPMPKGTWCTGRGSTVSGRRYVFGDNKLGLRSLSMRFGAQQSITLETAAGTATLPVGQYEWLPGETAEPARNGVLEPFFREAACCGAWEDGSFHLRIAFLCTTIVDDWFLRFTDHGVDVEICRRGSFAGSRYSLVGREA